MSTIALDSSNDLQITEGRLVLLTDNDEALAQKLRNKFLLGKGEWFLDTRLGVPYFEQIMIKNPNTEIIKQIFRQVILKTDGISSVDSVEISVSAERELSFSFRAVADSGAVITGGSGTAFIVENF